MEGLVVLLALVVWGGCWFFVVRSRRNKTFGAHVTGAFAGFLVAMILIGVLMPKPSPDEQRARDEAARIKAEQQRVADAENARREAEAAKLKDHSSMAPIICSNYVEDSLKAPKSADFPFGRAEGGVRRLEDQQYVIRSYVDAQNSFGAQLRTWYTCKIQYRSGEDANPRNWALLALDFDE